MHQFEHTASHGHPLVSELHAPTATHPTLPQFLVCRLATPLEADWASQREPLIIHPELSQPPRRRAWGDKQVRVAGGGGWGGGGGGGLDADSGWDDGDAGFDGGEDEDGDDHRGDVCQVADQRQLRGGRGLAPQRALQAVHVGLLQPVARTRSQGRGSGVLPALLSVDVGTAYGMGLQLDDGHVAWQPLALPTQAGAQPGSLARRQSQQPVLALPAVGRRAAAAGRPPPSPAILRADIVRRSPDKKNRPPVPHRSVAAVAAGSSGAANSRRRAVTGLNNAAARGTGAKAGRPSLPARAVAEENIRGLAAGLAAPADGPSAGIKSLA